MRRAGYRTSCTPVSGRCSPSAAGASSRRPRRGDNRVGGTTPASTTPAANGCTSKPTGRNVRASRRSSSLTSARHSAMSGFNRNSSANFSKRRALRSARKISMRYSMKRWKHGSCSTALYPRRRDADGEGRRYRCSRPARGVACGVVPYVRRRCGAAGVGDRHGRVCRHAARRSDADGVVISVGVDFGYKRDPSAIGVAEAEWRQQFDRREAHWLGRHLERLPLGTPYPRVANHVHAIMERLRQRRPDVALYVDATGVGVPVVQILRELGEQPIACYLTGGDRYVVDAERGDLRIGKAWLVSRLQALLQMRRLHLADSAEARAMAKELQDYEIRIDRETTNERFGAFK